MGRLETIRLDAQMEEFIDTQLRDGNYGSVDEVVDAALRVLQHKAERDAIEAAIIEGEQSGEPVEFDGEEFLSELHRKHVR
ncbi:MULTISPECIES: type II toxin-antitoxin system ParD family antitoxin [unclassified Rhizobium]|uniref:type II toxin-antitoxin system ParD family antitoxin n=1 Tax=unclassified Rhizobium TaxID=2613769 RepID=UPI001ADCE63A|nr:MULTISPECIES: type II toxin-antitoxin system ParD family antitoxin [unclassified Rhizobium]MBO9126015.1 type II toxin-antitoxin system ParD family antitoxin [Rhizobium sp. 16-488-2b]MBO9176599.1 type II toxin-antitoxin system ParD family antitoxin [Rhizobium sp. 16-488-2a]